jgi:ubiquinone/menaquinone biosynthesis C-methylase UbiE
MDSKDVSGGVEKFFDLLKNRKLSELVGIEMCCGKGRNVIGLVKQGEIKKMYGFDFSPTAIETAKERAREEKVSDKTEFSVGDAIKAWPYDDNTFDFVIDCFGSTDIEDAHGRKNAIAEIYRVLKPGGFLLLYTLSLDDEFHKEMILRQPAEERNSFYHDNGKFEKTFDEEEIRATYNSFSIVEWERPEKVTQFFGKDYACRHFWVVFQKPIN